MLLSLVIAAYNAMDYVQGCINAVDKQNFSDFEIVVADDGSTDRTGSLFDEWSGRDTRVKVLHIEHGGLIKARNEALRICRGDYVAFFDVDDDLEPNFISNFIQIIGEHKPDAIVCNYIKEDGSKRKLIKNKLSAGVYEDEKLEEFYKKMLCNGMYFEFGVNPFIWTKAFKRDIFLPFMEARDPDITEGEDAAAVFPAFLSCKKIVLSDSAGYHYLSHPTSMTHDRGEMYYSNAARLSFYLDQMFAKTKYYDWMRPQMKWYMRMLLYVENPNAFEMRAHIFPFGKVEKGSCVAIYGAGNVGELYAHQLRTQNYGELRVWVDGSWERMENQMISSPEKLVETQFDYVVIAIDNLDTIMDIREKLLSMGIPENKIVW